MSEGVFTRMSAKYQSDEGRKEIEDTEHEIAKLGVTLYLISISALSARRFFPVIIDNEFNGIITHFGNNPRTTIYSIGHF